MAIVGSQPRTQREGRRKLPIGIQTFRRIREEGCYYVDKTGFAVRLVEEGNRYFLSRPRRFGKSLFVDTLKELFEGSRELFQGLAAEEGWDWSLRCPVLRLDFSGANCQEPGRLEANIEGQIERIARGAGVALGDAAGPERFGRLIEELHVASGRRVAVLVDEYDKPILDAMGTASLARGNRDYLRGLYSAIKFHDARIEFALLTGVSKFSKVSLFSDLNNLRDITLEPPFSSICGYTDDDVDTVFAREIEGLDREAMREWYNGYSWLGEQRVYNPFDILLLLAKRTFSAHWFETGTPRFLIDTLLDRSVAAPSLEGMFCTDDLLSAFDVEEIGTEALLFQTGYLTIADVEDAGGSSVYRLGYPNREVRQSLNNRLLRAMAPDPSAQIGRGMALRRALDADDFPAIEALFRAFFASIPYNWFVRNRIADFEGYYASVFCSHFASAGLDVAVEDATGAGRLDMAVRHAESVHLFEFKVAESSSPGAALAQLRERRYAEKYRAPGRTIHLIGLEFSRRERNISRFDVAAG